MAWPTGVSTVAVTWGKGIGALGEGVAATLSLTTVMEGTPFVVWAITGDPFLPVTETILADANTVGSILLPVTDQVGWKDAAGFAYRGWHYVATVTYAAAGGKVSYTRSFQLATGQNVVDLDALLGTEVGIPTQVQMPAVTSVNGRTGAVILSADEEGDGTGPAGKSAYELAQAQGYTGTLADWLKTLSGPSAYQVAVANGYVGDEPSWLSGLQGPPGQDARGTDGMSAYQIAVLNGFDGTQQDWLASLQGPAGNTLGLLVINSGTAVPVGTPVNTVVVVKAV